MQTSRRLLIYGFCFLLSCCTVRGVRLFPPEAAHFPKCDTTLNECPANSTCELTSNKFYYCACFDTHYNERDKVTLTYPEGECLERCHSVQSGKSEGRSFPCACSPGFISKPNSNGLYVCTDKCTDNSDCPSGASCRGNFCYCNNGLCRQPQGKSCITLVKLNEKCGGKTTTTRPLLTSGDPTQQPVLNLTTIPPLTSNVTMGNTTYTHQKTRETHYTPFTTSDEVISITSYRMSQKTSEKPRALTPQTVYDRCLTKSTNEQEKCENHNSMDPLCIFLKSMVHIKEDACERNITNTSVQKVASQITNLLNQTSLEKLNFDDLQTVVVAVIENVETSLLASFSTDPRNQQINTSEIAAELKVPHGDCDEGSFVILTIDDNKMEVPCSLVNFIGGGAIFISYRGLNSRLNGSILAALGNSDETQEVISPVIGGAITNLNTENLDSPVTFSLKHLMAVKPNHSIRCVFWDTKNELWSPRGCKDQKSEQENSTVCVCSHLSTFAVIMAPTEIEVDTGLRVISIIGLSVSLVCLFLSFLTFILCRSLKSVHTSILTVLCACLFLGQLLVLVGLPQTWNMILCSVIAGSLHLIFLCAFCWMSLESILLFLTVRNLRAVNYMNSQRSYFPYVCLVGFGIPAIIVTVSASLYPHMYGEEKHCWLNINHVWSFLGPVCVFISANFILLVLTFWLLKKKLASLNSNVSTLKNTRLLTFKALSQLFILGCTWIIGLFQFGSGAIVASYLFTICNSLQGVYFFIVHCVLNHQVREEYSRGFRKIYSKKSISETVSGSTVPMTIKPSQVSEASKDDVLVSKF